MSKPELKEEYSNDSWQNEESHGAFLKPVADQSIQTSINVQASVGFWIRALAFAIDLMILGIASDLIWFFLKPFFNVFAIYYLGETHLNFAQGNFLFYLQPIITAWYFTVFTSLFAATPGKLICKLKVINSKGTNLSFRESFARMLSFFAILPPSFIFIIFRKDKRGLHDLLVNSHVHFKD